MASTTVQRRIVEVFNEFCSARGDPDGSRAAREHGVGRDRDLGRAHRARPRDRSRQRVQPGPQRELAGVHRRVCVGRAHVPRRRRGGSRRLPRALLGVDCDRDRLVRGAVRRCHADRARPARLEHESVADRGHGALDDEPRRRLRRPGRDRPEHSPRRQAHHERVLRDGHVHGDRAVNDLHQADRLVPRLPRCLRGADPRAPEDRAVVLQPLRRQGDRARDQDRFRDPARADGAGHRSEQPGRAAGVRARARDVPPLPAPP